MTFHEHAEIWDMLRESFHGIHVLQASTLKQSCFSEINIIMFLLNMKFKKCRKIASQLSTVSLTVAPRHECDMTDANQDIKLHKFFMLQPIDLYCFFNLDECQNYILAPTKLCYNEFPSFRHWCTEGTL